MSKFIHNISYYADLIANTLAVHSDNSFLKLNLILIMTQLT